MESETFCFARSKHKTRLAVAQAKYSALPSEDATNAVGDNGTKSTAEAFIIAKSRTLKSQRIRTNSISAPYRHQSRICFSTLQLNWLTKNQTAGINLFTEPDAVASLTRLAGKILVKDPKRIFPRLTWTALDVGGPRVETFGMNICKDAPAIAQGRELQEAAPVLTFQIGGSCLAIGCHIYAVGAPSPITVPGNRRAGVAPVHPRLVGAGERGVGIQIDSQTGRRSRPARFTNGYCEFQNNISTP